MHDIGLTLRQGEVLALLGSSGCGKSTLLNILAGFLEPDSGRILLEGHACGAPGPDRAVVFQEDALFPWLTASENVTLGLKAKGVSASRAGEQALGMLGRVGLDGFHDHLPGALSGGMRQRVALARVLALEPKVLLMDEPFVALDAITREQMQDLLAELHKALNMTILFVTHDIAEAVRLADTIIVMGREGQGFRARFQVDSPRNMHGMAFLELSDMIRSSLRA
ncbi:ABC transporter ATP-binding protein [Fundidesulfovibrio putealis]|uniref:ABC transporter ATP-binding protein n=1 Tax=Fundidesulfovibrio putealis TaxID=270496 RepID=UPI001F3BE5FD|nr:ABC transporter ATP-binding protein [Fundidesulfovibrio putealis]